MQCTPESNVFLESCKGQRRYDDCSDSGYSGLFQSPQGIGQVDSAESLSPGEYDEMSKENFRLSVTPKEKTRGPLGFLGKDYRGNQQPPVLSWSETPKREFSLCHRLLMCGPSTAVKTESTRSPCTRRTKTSIGVSAEHWVSASFDSLDTLTGALASSALKLEQDLQLSGRKRRLLFTQMRTSTLENGKLIQSSFGRTISLLDADFSESISASNQINIESPGSRNILPSPSKEISQSPIDVANSLYDSSDVLSTPSSMHTPKYVRYVQY